jgi:DegT/DnrJ/EryC1/StrS aminotransferase family protein
VAGVEPARTALVEERGVPVQRHPDAELAAKVDAALRWWLSRRFESGPARAPSSAITGGGAVVALEEEFSRLHAGRPTLLLPSATYALRAALAALRIGPGAEVIIPALDWTASRDAVRSVGATPVPVAVDAATLTLPAEGARRARTGRTSAAIACHLHGVPADVPALVQALDGLPVLEDCAGAFGSQLDGRQVGTLGNSFAVFSLGPGKTIDAGEGGVLVSMTPELHHAALAVTAHPLRQILAGLDPTTDPPPAFSIRPHVVTAILAMYGLSRWNPAAARADHRRTAEETALCDMVIGMDERRENAQAWVPVRRPQAGACQPGRPSGAAVLAEAGTAVFEETWALREGLGLLPVVTRQRAGDQAWNVPA